MINFQVYGKPEPAGSKRGFAFKRRNGSTGVAISDANPKSRDWKNAVTSAAMQHVGDEFPLLTGPLSVEFLFYLVRPKGHFGSGKNSDAVKGSAPTRPVGKPDVLKLARAVEDSLTGVVWRDDAQIVEENLAKHYGPRAGVFITIRPL